MRFRRASRSAARAGAKARRVGAGRNPQVAKGENARKLREIARKSPVFTQKQAKIALFGLVCFHRTARNIATTGARIPRPPPLPRQPTASTPLPVTLSPQARRGAGSAIAPKATRRPISLGLNSARSGPGSNRLTGASPQTQRTFRSQNRQGVLWRQRIQGRLLCSPPLFHLWNCLETVAEFVRSDSGHAEPCLSDFRNPDLAPAVLANHAIHLKA
jgi:hypothetical protein